MLTCLGFPLYLLSRLNSQRTRAIPLAAVAFVPSSGTSVQLGDSVSGGIYQPSCWPCLSASSKYSTGSLWGLGLHAW